MGQTIASMCARSDFFQNLVQKYGYDFVKFILCEKAKIYLQEKFIQIIAKIRQYVTVFQTKVNDAVDSNLKKLNQKFQQVKNKVNSVIPGGIQFLQRQKGKNICEFSGFNDINTQIDSIRDQTLLQVHSQKGQVQNQILQKKNLLHHQIQNQRPKVPLYDDLPQEVRIKIFLKAEKEFKEQIEKKRQQMDGKCDQIFNQVFGKMDQYISKLNPNSILENLVDKSVNDMANKVLGNGPGGVIGGIAGRIF